jgi:hypothetical protein
MATVTTNFSGHASTPTAQVDRVTEGRQPCRRLLALCNCDLSSNDRAGL